MPKGPQGQKRPADVIGCAVAVARIAIGEVEEKLEVCPEQLRIAKTGGRARSKKLTKQERSSIARKAAAKRWGHDNG